MYGNGHSENERLQRRLGGICCLLLTHALVNFAVGLYRCHDLAPLLTDLLATALPRAQTTLLILWLVLGRARFLWRLCAFIGGHALIFSNYTTWMLPGFHELLVPWNPKIWNDYFTWSLPGDWLVRLPFLVAGIIAPLGTFRFTKYFYFRNQAQNNFHNQPRVNKAHQFRLVDIGVVVATTCLVLNAIMTPGYLFWFTECYSHLQQRIVGLTRLLSSPGEWLFILVPLVVVIQHKVNGLRRYRFLLQLLTTVVVGLIFSSAQSEKLFLELAVSISTMTLISLSLFFLEFIESPAPKIQQVVMRELPEKISVVGSSESRHSVIEFPSLKGN